jgi:glycosyltransferase involved in cell wall biosynthesis
MLPVWVVVLLLLGAVAVLLYQGVAIVFAYQMPRLEPEASPTEGPGPSVVIAARNEAGDLPATLDSLLAQTADLPEIVVVDGGSTDGTADVARARGSRVRLIEEPPLPEGWVGKSWACWTGARATDGEWLLFLDADVRLDPHAVSTVLAWARREGADLASIGSRIEMGSAWERIVMPFYVQMVLTHFRSPHVNRPHSSAAVANGQFLLVRRASYQAVGGHEAIRSQIVEDVALAERFRALGRKLRFAYGPSLARTRMYRGRGEMFEGLLRTVHGTRYSTARQIGRLVGLVGLFLLPLGLLPLGIVAGSVALVAMGAFLYVALFGKHVAFARATGAPAVYGLLYPVAVTYYVRLLWISMQRGAGNGSVGWKGRQYRLRADPALAKP